jgi:hypothetical protein
MAKVQAIAGKAGTRWAGYYGHKRIRVGEVLDIPELDKDGFYVDEKGKRVLDPVFDREGKQRLDADGKPVFKERKCAWLARVGTPKAKQVDPVELAKVLSGKNPGSSGRSEE